MREITFAADGEKLAVALFEPSGGASHCALLLHGAGDSTKERVFPLAADLAARGAVTLTFDFSGHGASSGTIAALSLERRFAQASAVIEEFADPGAPLLLAGFSMSGQTVGDLLGAYRDRVAGIGLCSPAVYTRAAWRTPFTAQFTGQIRVPGAWADSGALDAFRRYTGRAVLALPERDEVIPTEVTETVAAALAQRAALTRLEFAGADHKLGSWLATRPAQRGQLIDALLGRSDGAAGQQTSALQREAAGTVPDDAVPAPEERGR